MGACTSVPKAMRDEAAAPAPEPFNEVLAGPEVTTVAAAGEVSEEKASDEGGDKNKDEAEVPAAEEVSEEKVDDDKKEDEKTVEVDASKEEATQEKESVVEEKKSEDRTLVHALFNNLIGHFNH